MVFIFQIFYVNIFEPLMSNENFLVLYAIIDHLIKTVSWPILKKNSPEKEMYFKKFIFAFFQIWINTSKMFIIMSRLQQVPPIISLLLIKFLILLQRPLFWVKEIIHIFHFSKDLLYCLYNIKK